jgi:hypothetical protein
VFLRYGCHGTTGDIAWARNSAADGFAGLDSVNGNAG